MKLKKRLPALFLALFLAFSPLILAAPASASSEVLSGPGFFYISSSFGFEAFFPDSYRSYCCWMINDTGFEGNSPSYAVLAVSDSPLVVDCKSLLGRSISFNHNDVLYAVAPVTIVDGFILSFDFRNAVFTKDRPLGNPYPYVSVLGDASYGEVSGDFQVGSLVPEAHVLHTGVFSVFSGVGSWLGGAVNNMISMFYTAESGLTVLGVLAVASLALAFILLLLYLIAGWLKFR